MKNKQRQLVIDSITAVVTGLNDLKTGVRDSTITSSNGSIACSTIARQLAAIRDLFEKDIKSPYEVDVGVYFEGELYTIKDYEGDLLALKKGNDVKLARVSEVSLTAPVAAPKEPKP
jgi:hypothetical protein